MRQAGDEAGRPAGSGATSRSASLRCTASTPQHLCTTAHAHLTAPSGSPSACRMPPSPQPLLPARQAHAPPAPPSQNTAGAPKVYTGDSAEMGSTPRRTYMSSSTVPRLPPSEWPVNETCGQGQRAEGAARSATQLALLLQRLTSDLPHCLLCSNSQARSSSVLAQTCAYPLQPTGPTNPPWQRARRPGGPAPAAGNGRTAAAPPRTRRGEPVGSEGGRAHRV